MKIRATLLLLATTVAGALFATGAPASANVEAKAIRTYWVTLRTGDLDRAGTDARVHVTVIGDAANSPRTRLTSDANNFERGRTETFGPFKWISIGRPTSIILSKTNSGSEWFPEYVHIFSEADGEVYECPINTWYGDGNETRTFSCS